MCAWSTRRPVASAPRRASVPTARSSTPTRPSGSWSASTVPGSSRATTPTRRPTGSATATVFRSGDLAYRDAEGFFYFAGRTGEWLRVDGENLAVAPIERALSELEGVVAVAVYAVPDPQVGDLPMAAVVPSPDRRIDADVLEAWWAARADLSAKARPRFVRVTHALEQTATYKTVKRGLAAEGWDCGDPVLWSPAPDAAYRPMTDVDRARLREVYAAHGRSHLLPSSGPAASSRA
jgi:fatty-acyl-CoA synthase